MVNALDRDDEKEEADVEDVNLAKLPQHPVSQQD